MTHVEIAMNRIITLICLAAMSAGSIDTKAQELQSRIEKLVSSDAASQAAVSICAIKGDGQKLVDINSSMMLVPASNMKLISTGAAVHHLGPEFRFETSIGHDGEITEGVLNGNVYIIGGGDPTLGSTDSIATPIEKVFSQWHAMLKNAGISQINGRIIGDGSLFDQTMEHPTWLMEDIGTYYGAGTTGLMFYENMQSFRVSAGAYVGDSVNITPSYPQTPWMEFRYSCTTGENGTGDKLFLYTSDLAPVAEVRGTFGLDRTAKRLDCSNKFPEYTCAYYFKEYLNQNGIVCDSIGDFRLDKEWIRRGEIKELGKTYSPQLRRIIFETNHISNNVFAETLLRSLGREMTGDACYESSCIAIANILTGLGIDTSRGARIKDGSGLSRQNYISSDFFCRFLLGMMESPHFEHFVNSLPSPGSDGSMIYNMRKYSDSIKSRIKVKSGSMNGVRCYSGYVIPTDGGKEDVIIFSLMINNCTSSSGQMRNLMDSIMAELAKEN
jgi:D-alanyl-D-alanine carboxypeptidase/D-alanyl-D-alanine-endopeptidase (penicillin-binding protein 4)